MANTRNRTGNTVNGKVNMRKRNKQLTLDILTGMTATAASNKHNISRRNARNIIDQVLFEVKFRSIHSFPDHNFTVTGYKSIADRLIPAVHNHYKVG